ncbi:secreted RxLR effector protein 161-like [Elaeis guineensis]|uniref:secreted RxLR effector protein 161-like n=1 Tax=Elaeis guineensis var. tenera TaxID=51953 RepID=UPI003C6DB2EF
MTFFNGDLKEEVYMKQPDGFSSNDSIDYWRATKKVMRYLEGTKDYMLMYRRSDELEVVDYSGSDFTGCIDSRKSTSGYIFMFAGGAISWKSVKQTLTAISTMEAEPLRIFYDNLAAVFLAKNNRNSSRSKYIDIKFLAIRKYVKKNKVVIEHVSIELMIADPLTKASTGYRSSARSDWLDDRPPRIPGTIFFLANE